MAALDVFRFEIGGGTLSLELLHSEVTSVVVLNDLMSLRRLRWFCTAQEQRAKWDVPPSELPIILDQDSVEPRKEEDSDKKRNRGTNTDNDADGLRIVELDA